MSDRRAARAAPCPARSAAGRPPPLALLLLLITLASCHGPAPRPEAEGALDRLVQLIDARLALAPRVAQAKWNADAPIDDPAREVAILAEVTRRAAAAGLDEPFARRFFQAQFEAGKQIQQRLHDKWRRQRRGPFAQPPDLAREVRPALDRLTGEIIAVLVELRPRLTSDAVQARLAEVIAEQKARGAEATAWLLALEPLRPGP